MTIFRCAACQQPVTSDVVPGEPLGAPERPLSDGVAAPRMARGTFKINVDSSLLILHPDDLPGTTLHPDRGRLSGCCGIAGQDGPNLVCAGCRVDVATKESDCWTDNLVALIAAAVTDQPETSIPE
ncbi:hypothetical protein ACPCUK_14465 [Streptomyces arboris]|uniref:hypothetical protein n=1 Tax=Streptomyces arboris TaxID=2600619 RepID=UPI003C2C00AA